MRSGLLIDTNLLVLCAVGAANRDRSKTFKRTSQSSKADPLYKTLGLLDAATGAVARAYGCKVLTDDPDLYLHLSRDGVEALNFAHLQAANRESGE